MWAPDIEEMPSRKSRRSGVNVVSIQALLRLLWTLLSIYSMKTSMPFVPIDLEMEADGH